MEKQIEVVIKDDKIINFLLGKEDINGLWFGDKNEFGVTFWWRSLLREALSKAEEPTLAQAHIQPPRTNELRHDADIPDNSTDTKQDLLNQEGVNGAAYLMFSKAEDKGGIQDCSLRINGKTMAETLSQQPTNSLYVKEKLTDQVFKVWKYIESNDGEVSVWCNDWYGRHVIGQDCEFLLPPKP